MTSSILLHIEPELPLNHKPEYSTFNFILLKCVFLKDGAYMGFIYNLHPQSKAIITITLNVSGLKRKI